MPQRSETYRRWSSEMRRSEMFRAGERVGVAVSGGPDSVLLLDFMAQLAGEIGLVVSAVHFNHHLRGDESEGDEKLVGRMAQERGLEFLRGEARVAEVARERRRNLEATARDLRYRYFLSLISQRKLDKIVTAHTANDQAETVLLRLFRGTGSKGLGGIYPVLEGKIARPFLGLGRAEIEEEIRRRQLKYRVDSSNRNTQLRRNKIRLELLPLLEKEYSPEIVRLLAALAARARDDEAFLEEQARERSNPWRLREGESEKIALRPLGDFPPGIARRVLRQMLQATHSLPAQAGTTGGLTHRHVEDLRRFAAEAQSGKSLTLPGLTARKEFDWLIVSPAARGGERSPTGRAGREFSYAVKVPGTVNVPELGVAFEFKIVRAGGMGKGYNDQRVAGLDPRKLTEELALRNWRAGDRYQPAGSQRPSKLKELFQREKIPLGERRLWPVLAGAEGILWVRGFPPARAAAAAPRARERVVVKETPLGPSDAKRVDEETR